MQRAHAEAVPRPGQHRFELGDRDAARADAATARDEFEAMEAVRDRAMAEALLRK